MSLSTILLDFIPLFACISYAVQGYRRGAVTQFFHIVNVLFSYWTARLLAGYLQKLIIGMPVIGQMLETKTQEVTSQIAGMGISENIASGMVGTNVYTVFGLFLFVILFLLVSWMISEIIRLTQVVNRIPLIGLFNKILGAILGFALCAFLIAIFLHFLFWAFINIGLTLPAKAVAASFFYNLF